MTQSRHHPALNDLTINIVVEKRRHCASDHRAGD
jgi:hypothetical protein